MGMEVQSTKGKGWILAGMIIAGLGVLTVLGGHGGDGMSAILLGACVYGVGKAIRWWVRVDN